MHEILTAQIGWSRSAFGVGTRVKGNTAHVLKELLEFRDEPSVEEAVDIAMLGMDGLWRQMAETFPDATDAELAECVAIAYDSKLLKNTGRTYERTPEDVPAEGRPGKWKPTDAVFDVMAERCRQVEGEGWTVAHDDAHSEGQLVEAADSYIMAADYTSKTGNNASPDVLPPVWPWARNWWKPSTPRRMLVKAAALIIAEIERLDRKEAGK